MVGEWVYSPARQSATCTQWWLMDVDGGLDQEVQRKSWAAERKSNSGIEYPSMDGHSIDWSIHLPTIFGKTWWIQVVNHEFHVGKGRSGRSLPQRSHHQWGKSQAKLQVWRIYTTQNIIMWVYGGRPRHQGDRGEIILQLANKACDGRYWMLVII